MVFECATQPWKALYLGYEICSTTFVRLPLWALRYIWPAMRPYPSWSFGHAITVEILRRSMVAASVTGGIRPLPDSRAISPAVDAEGVWIEGTPHLVTGELKTWAFVSEVAPERIPGYWYGKKGASFKPTTSIQPGEKVFYCFHGGGYVQLSAHPKDFTSNIIRALIELDDSAPHALALEYRLSATYPLPDRNPFPAALLDALAGYNYLVNVMGYSPSNIILTGDSAGGNLALALTRYLVENRNSTDASLPAPPGHLLLLSPWTDLSNSHDWPGSSMINNTADFLKYHDTGRSLYSKHALLGPFGLGFGHYHRYISPASLHPSAQARFNGFPRTFLAVGTAERFLDPVRTLKKRMTADMGEGDGEGQLTYLEAPDAVHDFLVFSWHPCRPATLKAIRQWLA
ncbi:hypothetical protein HYDPIDRAFT_83502 [Hydnomerulius pinastri MD-312]|nr:hypothetical protein HYDPIDRAFT_83502 [Hydnomerulius pinastri MD-312]